MIFIPKKNIYFPQPKWGLKKFQRGMLHPMGFWAATGAALDTTVTVGSRQFDVTPDPTSPVPCDAFGYDNGVDYLSLAAFGSIGSATYTDGGSTSRTISAIYYTEFCSNDGDDDNLHFCLNATSISNTDTTFVSIDYDGVNYLRSAATYSGTVGSCSSWRWLNISPDGPQSGTPALLVNI